MEIELENISTCGVDRWEDFVSEGNSSGRLNFKVYFTRDAGKMVVDNQEAEMLSLEPEISEEIFYSDFKKKIKVIFCGILFVCDFRKYWYFRILEADFPSRKMTVFALQISC